MARVWKALIVLMSFVLVPTIAGADEPVVPDDVRTPGALNPDVTQDTIDTTICVSGWTATIRPLVAETNALKAKQLNEWGYDDQNMQDYEEDHRIPLEVGGNPHSPDNLWPEPYDVEWGARVKDKLETFAKREVCARRMTLSEGQALFQGDWIAAFRKCCGDTPSSHCTGTAQ